MQNYSRFSYHDILMYERSVLHLPVIVEDLPFLYRLNPLDQGIQSHYHLSHHDILMYKRSFLYLPVIVEDLASLYRFFILLSKA
mgnify:CR=1 FL=1